MFVNKNNLANGSNCDANQIFRNRNSKPKTKFVAPYPARLWQAAFEAMIFNECDKRPLYIMLAADSIN